MTNGTDFFSPVKGFIGNVLRLPSLALLLVVQPNLRVSLTRPIKIFGVDFYTVPFVYMAGE